MADGVIFAAVVVLFGAPLVLLMACAVFPLLAILVKAEVELAKETWKWIKTLWKSE